MTEQEKQSSKAFWELHDRYEKKVNEILCLKDENQRLRKALEFYANKQHFRNYEDGLTARQALGEEKV